MGLVFVVVSITGCDAGDTTGIAHGSDPSPPITFAKAAPAQQPLARYTFADSANTAAPGMPASWSRAGITGDGRRANGSASTGSPSNEYQGRYCGVYAVTGTGQAEGLNTDSDIDWTSSMQAACGGPRLFRFFLGGFAAAPTLSGPHTVIDSLGMLTVVGQSSARLVKFGVQLPNCAGIRFGSQYAQSANAKVTRLPNVTTPNGSARSWVVESQGSHRGACVVAGKHDFVATGVTYYLPFALTITEVLPPFTQYP